MPGGTEVARLFVRIGADTTQLVAGVAGAQSLIANAGAAMMKTGAAMTMGLTIPIVAAGSAMVDTAATFEQKMNLLKVLTGSSAAEMDMLRTATMNVGSSAKSFGIDALGAADAVIELSKAGLSVNDIYGDVNAVMRDGANSTGALQAAIELAAASDLDMVASSELIVATMATYNIAAGDAQSATDRFVATANASVLEVSDLAAAFKNAAPTAAIFGISMEDLSTALAVMSQHGIMGAEAGTAFKRMLSNIQRPTKAVTEAMADLGLSIYDSGGNIKDVRTIISEFQDALFGAKAAARGMTSEQRNQYIQTIAGVYGMKTLNALLVGGVDAWDSMSASIEQQATAEEVAAARMEGFKGAFLSLKKAATDFFIKAATPFMQEFLTPAVGKITSVVQSLGALDPKWLSLGMKIAAVVAIAGPLLLIFGAIVTAIGAILSPIGLVIAGIVALGAAFIKAQGGVEALGNKIESIKTIFAGSGTTGEKTTSALKILGLPDNMAEAIGTWVGQTIETVKTTMTRLKEIFASEGTTGDKTGQVLALLGLPEDVSVSIGGWVDRAIKTIQETVGRVKETIASDGNTIDIVSAIFGLDPEKVAATIQGIVDRISAFFAPLGATIQDNMEPIKKSFANLKTSLGELWITLQPVVQILGIALLGALTLISGILSGVAVGAVKAFDKAINALSGTVTFIKGEIKMLTGVIELIVGIIEDDSDKIEAAWGKIKEGFKTAWEGLKTTVSELVSGFGEFLGGLLSGAIDSVAGLITGEASKVGTNLVDGIKKGLSDAWGSITSWLSEQAAKLPDWIKGPMKISSPSKVMAEVGKEIPAGLAQGISGGGASLADALMQISEYFMRFAQNTNAATAKNMKNVASAFKDMAKGVDKLVGSIAKLQAMQPPTAGSTNADMFGAWLDQFLILAEMAMTRIEAVIEAFGYNRIHKLRLTARRMKEIIESVMVDLSGITERNLPDLDVWFGQLHEVFNRAAWFIESIRAKYSNNMLEKMAEVAANVKAMYAVMQVSLEDVKPIESPDWQAQIEAYFGQLIPLAGMIVAWLGGFSQSVRNMIANAAETAANVSQLWQVFTDLSKIAPSTSETFMDDAALYVQQLMVVGGLIVAWLSSIGAEAQEMVKGAADIAEPVAKVFDILGVDLSQVVPPAPNFMALFMGFLAALSQAAELLIPYLEQLRATFGQDVLDAAAKTAEAVKTIFEVLGVGQMFADLVDLSKVSVGTLMTQLVAKLGEGLDVLVPALQTIQSKWGSTLESVKGVAETIKGVISSIAEIITQINDMIAKGIPTPEQLGATFAQLSAFMGAAATGAAGMTTVTPAAPAGPLPVSPTGGIVGGGAPTGTNGDITLHLDIKVNGEPFQTLTQRLTLGRTMDITLGELAVTG